MGAFPAADAAVAAARASAAAIAPQRALCLRRCVLWAATVKFRGAGGAGEMAGLVAAVATVAGAGLRAVRGVPKREARGGWGG